MDTDFIREYLGLFVSVGIALLLGLFGNKDKKSKKRPQAQQPKRPAQAPRRPAQRAAAPAAARTPKVSKPDSVGASTLPTEGERVTRDLPRTPQPARNTPALKALDRDGLRNAVIWGEILKPKF